MAFTGSMQSTIACAAVSSLPFATSRCEKKRELGSPCIDIQAQQRLGSEVTAPIARADENAHLGRAKRAKTASSTRASHSFEWFRRAGTVHMSASLATHVRVAPAGDSLRRSMRHRQNIYCHELNQLHRISAADKRDLRYVHHENNSIVSGLT